MQIMPRHWLAALVAACGVIAVPAPAAHAFTIDNQSSNSGSGGARYADPDEQFSNSGNGLSTYHLGDTTVQFGGQPQSFDQRYNSNRMFDPLGRPGDDR